MTRLKKIGCPVCGKRPDEVRENDGFYYVICPAKCDGAVSWGKTRTDARNAWSVLVEQFTKAEPNQ